MKWKYTCRYGITQLVYFNSFFLLFKSTKMIKLYFRFFSNNNMNFANFNSSPSQKITQYNKYIQACANIQWRLYFVSKLSLYFIYCLGCVHVALDIIFVVARPRLRFSRNISLRAQNFTLRPQFTFKIV